MSQYPLDTKTDLVEAVNYLLSGPGSLGQNFQGMSAVGLDAVTSEYQYGPIQTYLTGMTIPGSLEYRTPAELPGAVDYPADPLAPGPNYPIWNTLPGGLPIIGITPITSTGHKIEVIVTIGTLVDESQTPFANGQQIVLSGVTPSSYDGTYTVVDYLPSATLSPFVVTLFSETEQTWDAYTSGGVVTINDNFTGTAQQRFFTGNQAVVSVSGPSDRVFVSSQMNDLIVYTYTKFQAILAYNPKLELQLNRYKAVSATTLPDIGTQAIYASAIDNAGTYAGFNWVFDKNIVTVAEIINWDVLGSQVYTNDLGDVIFNNVIDNPGIGVYLYAFQISMEISNRDLAPNTGAILLVGASTTGVRSFTAQVIKQ